MSDEEFKINEPKVNKTPMDMEREIAEREKAILFSLKCKYILNKDNLNADNIFQAVKDDFKVCILTDIIPCNEAHCMSCNMPMLHHILAKEMLAYIGDSTADNLLREVKKKKAEKVNEKRGDE